MRLLYRAFGSTLVLLGMLFFLLRSMNRGAALHGGHDLQMIWKPAILIIALGTSLIALQRWAMAIVVLGCTAMGVFLTVGPFFEIRKSLWVLLNLPFGIAFLVPLLFVAKHWHESRRHIEDAS
jgi:hypothetical protein